MQITLTLDFTPETADALQVLIGALNKKPMAPEPEPETESAPEAPAKTSRASRPAKAAKPEAPAEDATPVVTFTDVRAKALAFSQAGKQAALKEIFAKYGAAKLSDISEDQFPALLADLESANG